MACKFHSFLSILFATFILLGNAAIAGPTVTVPPASSSGSSSSSEVCDPDVAQMLADAGAAQIARDKAIINSTITRPPSVFELSCYEEARAVLAGGAENATPGGTGQQSNCAYMGNFWQQTAQGGSASGGASPQIRMAGFDKIDLMSAAIEPVSLADNKCHPGIPTGVKINGKNEIVCPNPGCYPKLDGDAYKCEKY